MKTNFTRLQKLSFGTLLKSCSVLFVLAAFSISSKAQTVYAITSANNLISFSATAPANVLTSFPITGMLAGHTMEGLDFRPATGQLYAFSYNATNGESQVYRIKTGTGMLTAVGAPLTLATGMSSIGFDFNPTVDRIRLTSASRQNYRLNPINGTLAATDGQLAYAVGDPNASATPNIRAAAYTNSFAGATTTTIYYYDFNLNVLASSSLPNNGTLNTVGSSTITAVGTSGTDLDIVSGTNVGYLMAGVAAGSTNLYTLNLATGAAALVGAIGSGLNVVDMAIVTNPPPVAKLVYAASGNNLISFYSNNPATIVSTVAFSGIAAGQTLVGMDFRPATGQLFAMGYVPASGLAQLYSVNLSTGVATVVGAASTLALNMTGIGFDFNPTVDRIRITSKTRQNYRLNPNDGTIAATDGTLTYMAGDANAAAIPAIQAVAYTNSFAGSTATTIYYYDITLNILANSTNPNGGVINTIGSSAITANTTADVDMDISSNQAAGTNIAYALASINGTSSNFYTVNLTTGATTSVGAIGAGLLVSEMAVYIAPPPPAKNVYAVQGNNLINFSSSNPSSIISSFAITGITAGQTIVGLDFRPATGQLFAMGYVAATGATQLYIVANTGVATPVGAAVTLATNMTGIGFDFNPTVDRIRVTSSSRKNYRLNPNDGTIAATDTDLTYAVGDTNALAQPDVQAVAYTNSLAGATATTLYYYDFTLDNLASSAAPNAGALSSVGRSGIISTNATGLDMDILTDATTLENTAFVSANVSGTASNLYLLNLTTGEATLIGTIGGTGAITEMAVSSLNLTLPVTVTDFTLQKVGRTSKLKWITKSEINNANFVVERSSNGVNFKTLSPQIASKAVGGNSNLNLNYDYTDIIPAKGVNYYRLLQTDKDGTKKYSQVLQAQFDDVAGIKMYPSPTKGLINLSANIYENVTLSIRVTDAAGKAVRSYQYQASEGIFNNRIDLGGLQSGTYFVTIADGKTFKYNQAVQKL